MFVSQEELNDENLSPVKRLAASSRQHGVKNGIIINNKLLEDRIRQEYGDQLIYVSSCTKYVSPDKILSPLETLSMYRVDIQKYDYVVATPQDSRRKGLLEDITRENRFKLVAICNFYHHYEYTSRENKRTLVHFNSAKMVGRAISFLIPRLTTCSAVWRSVCRVNVKKIARMQLEAGVINFKLGRGLGAELLDHLVSVIRGFEESGT